MYMIEMKRSGKFAPYLGLNIFPIALTFQQEEEGGGAGLAWPDQVNVS